MAMHDFYRYIKKTSESLQKFDPEYRVKIDDFLSVNTEDICHSVSICDTNIAILQEHRHYNFGTIVTSEYLTSKDIIDDASNLLESLGKVKLLLTNSVRNVENNESMHLVVFCILDIDSRCIFDDAKLPLSESYKKEIDDILLKRFPGYNVECREGIIDNFMWSGFNDKERIAVLEEVGDFWARPAFPDQIRDGYGFYFDKMHVELPGTDKVNEKHKRNVVRYLLEKKKDDAAGATKTNIDKLNSLEEKLTS